MLAEVLGAGRLKPARLLVLEKLRQFGVVYRAIAVLIVHVEEAVDLRRGCGFGFGLGVGLRSGSGFWLKSRLSEAVTRARVKVGMRAQSAQQR